MNTMTTLEHQICSYLNGLNNENGNDSMKVSIETDLFEEGILDSLGLISLLSYVEKELGVDIRDADFKVSNFSTVKNIAKLVAAYIDGSVV